MTDDDKRRAERRRRMDELLSEAEADVTRTRAAKERPVVEQRGGPAWGSALGVAILLALAAVLVLGALTVNRLTGADYDDADRRGTATVVSCERRGPITTKGFGYFDQCTVDIEFSDGEGPTVVIDKPGFMKGERPGDTFEIGRNDGSRGSVAYSRPEVPARGWATAITIALAALAFLCVAGVYLFARQTIRDLRRRS